MIDALIKWSLENRLFVALAAIGFVVWGFLQARQMPVDVFPDLSAPTVTVVAEAHGMAPEEVEQLITFPIESALNGASGVARVRSSTSVGNTVVWVEFEWGTDIYKARQIVSEKLSLVQPALPPDVDPPVMAPVSSVMGEILFIGLTSDSRSPREVRTFADWEVRRRILAVPGVSNVIPIGGAVQQYQVLVRPESLRTYNMGVSEVVDAVSKTNQNVSAGFYENNGKEYLIYGLGRAGSAPDVSETIIKMVDGVPVRVGDVATVVVGDAIKRGDGSINGNPGVVLGIQKQPNVNTLELTGRIDRVLDDVENGLPDGVVLQRSLLRQADFIDTSVNNVTHALRDGSILVVLIVGFFLFSGRATLIAALAIPLSLLVSVTTLHLLGASLNTMTLGGMAIAVGALVDDAIIDVENVVKRLREHKPRSMPEVIKVVFEASKEVRGSIVFATLIIVLVFLPLFFLSGIEGRLLEPLGVAYIVSLLASLVVALTVTPVLCAWLLPTSKAVSRAEEPALTRLLRHWYEASLRPIIRSWPAMVVVSVVGVSAALWWGASAGRAFLPAFNEGALTVSVVTLPGTSLTESNRIGAQAEHHLAQVPEVVSTARRTGRAELDEHAQAISASEIDVQLKMGERSEDEMLADVRARLSKLRGTNVVVGQPISHRIDHILSGTRANIAVKVFGPDLYTLREIAKEIETKMQGVPGVVDLQVEEQTSLPLATLEFDRVVLVQHGLSVEQLSESVETAFFGHPVSRVMEGTRAFDLVVRYPEAEHEDLQAIKETMIHTPSGAWVPLEALARVRTDVGPSTISRESGQRKTVVMCNVGEGRDLGSVVSEIQGAVADGVTFPPGYYVEYGGQFEAAEKASTTLGWLSVLVIVGIFALLYSAFSSAKDAGLVMLNLPLALIGGVAGIFVSGGVVTVASIIGLITLFGIATRNGIIMVTHIRHLVAHEGVVDPAKAVVQGASERLAPILMTALASGLGLVPLAMASGEPGSEIQAPMAIVILCGLATSTLLNMYVLPSLMLRFGFAQPPAAER